MRSEEIKLDDRIAGFFVGRFRAHKNLHSLGNPGVAAVPEQRSSVELVKSVDLPGYTGDFGHFAADYDQKRLLLAAEDDGTLEIFDLKTSDHLRTVAGFGNPHSILVRKGRRDRLYHGRHQAKRHHPRRDHLCEEAGRQPVTGLRHGEVRCSLQYRLVMVRRVHRRFASFRLHITPQIHFAVKDFRHVRVHQAAQFLKTRFAGGSTATNSLKVS